MERSTEVAGDGAAVIVVIKSFLRFGHILLGSVISCKMGLLVLALCGAQ